MANTSVFIFSGSYIPPEIKERYNNWFDAAYAPLYLKNGKLQEIDLYKIIKKTYAMPPDIRFYHTLNQEVLDKSTSDSYKCRDT